MDSSLVAKISLSALNILILPVICALIWDILPYQQSSPELTRGSLHMYQLCFYVPESHLEEVKAALFEAGAGKLGHYDLCSWETEGRGQFRPLEGSCPFVGDENKIQHMHEFKVEMICPNRQIKTILNKLLEVHPYETPAYSVYEVKTIVDFT